ncbi:MAG TPA: RNA polymerase sigma factor SigJ [Vicinamibacterales bacterium]|nr:RNA polymerase sigma factor SigJ [Vicinamibacterales bacterium]
MIPVERFQALRPYLFSIAYRMLGSASEAEDVLQDAWLRASRAPEALESDRAWLAAVVTRLCLDRLESARATREQYVGPWLPEPMPTDVVPAPERDAVRRESITMAFLLLLERLSPAERAAFLLREVFDYGYGEVGRILDTTDAAVRQMVHRARERLVQGRRRFDVDPELHRETVSRFLAAARDGDLTELEAILVPEATYTADGGGRVPAARRIVEGARAVALVFAGLFRTAEAQGGWRAELGEVNGEPALLAFHGGRLDTVFVFSVAAGRVESVHAVRNPDKLAWLRRYLRGGRGAAPGAGPSPIVH